MKNDRQNSQNQDENTQPKGNFFDQMMFGNKGVIDQSSEANQQPQANATTKQTDSESNNENEDIDFDEIMEHVGNLMNNADKLKPALKQFGPIIDFVKSFKGSGK
ncbi:hypothetical protein [Texcoconibacillus texcoconensis]|uniref:Uncharacterized protein n=1 Tax=Texcoconibacillus texcoconensis TaxID=1095777 RepID=A0A840QTF8_9BACI|nr:hypothetical protein [Texcoconibacillus texcoconensis]MBB5174826.1 hypothetical protein [Texcoconibacillus texcoconensis]